MTELSLHILDIAQNSIKAGADRIHIGVNEDIDGNLLTITVSDNGCGMSEELKNRVLSPFTTTRTTRKIGLGLPLLNMAAELSGGKLDIWSKEGVGTKVVATFVYNHIDRMPIGDLAATMTTLIQGNANVEFELDYKYKGKDFYFDTGEVKTKINPVSIDNAEIIKWLYEYITESIEALRQEP